MEGMAKKNKIYGSLEIVAPGTRLRIGLENIVRAKTGALIVIGDEKEVLDIVDGGFNINSEYTPSYIYELAKMDGAIILSSDCKKILYANAQLIPNQNISSKETGTRHRTAERVAKQCETLVIAISQRRNVITLYKGEDKYILKESSEILNKANQAIQTLEKYKTVLDQAMNNLTALEFENLVTVYDVSRVIQRLEMVSRVAFEIERYILELGNEGRLISMQLNELMSGVDEDGYNVVKDYSIREEKYTEVRKEISNFSSNALLSLENIGSVLGYSNGLASLDTSVYPKGYRILSKIPRLPLAVLENVIKMFGSFQEILKASVSDLDLVDGIGKVRARTIKEGIRRCQEQAMIDRTLI
ncbi:MAG TPA: DNA integrity scanning diadenylate cyclase DisA [Tissierellales bacterium]|nr:DNA integrity scanning diadenylate cyclase DisA [Tissierellales bacterium]